MELFKDKIQVSSEVKHLLQTRIICSSTECDFWVDGDCRLKDILILSGKCNYYNSFVVSKENNIEV